jgi:hypothetical protein
MPWTVKDVDRHKKGLTPAQKKKWVSIANGVLKDCQAKGGKGCDAKAIRVANSKFSEGRITMKEEKTLPKGALRFVDHDCHAYVELKEDTKKPTLRMVAYSGGVIRGHWYWDNLAIDLEGIQFKESRYPVLEDHRSDRKIAHIPKPVIEDGKLMAPPGAVFLKSEAAEEFIQNTTTSPPFPYQSSIYAKSSNVERIEEGASAKVNGFTLKGPASIWRKCEFKEMSVCVFGWDSKTKASAFSREETEEVDFLENTIPAEDAGITEDQNSKQGKEVSEKMNKEELMENHSDLIQEIVDEAVSKVEAKFSEERKDLNAKLSAEKDANSEMSTRVQKLEKNDLIRQEEGFKSSADSIWTRKLADSRVPTHLHEKVSGFVSYGKYVKEDDSGDRKFDKAAFAEAVDVEIKDWEDKGVVDTVIGSGFTEKEISEEGNKVTKLAEENDAIVSRMLKSSGVELPT